MGRERETFSLSWQVLPDFSYMICFWVHRLCVFGEGVVSGIHEFAGNNADFWEVSASVLMADLPFLTQLLQYSGILDQS